MIIMVRNHEVDGDGGDGAGKGVHVSAWQSLQPDSCYPLKTGVTATLVLS